MELLRIYPIAKTIQPFIKGDGDITPEGIYKIITTNQYLSFINELISPDNLPVLVFTAYQLSIGNYDEKIVGKIKNNLFGFNTYEFGDTENNVDCPKCDGGGEVSCSECDGNGSVECRTCDGTGEEDCDECNGTGEDNEGDSCSDCHGGGKFACSNCAGDASEDCSECGGGGNVSCWECEGTGEHLIDDKVPYSLSIYVSYDTQLKNEIESIITQNKDIEGNSLLNEKTLTIFIADYEADTEEVEEVDLKFANKNYFGKIVDFEELIITKNRNNKLTINNLDNLEERFYK